MTTRRFFERWVIAALGLAIVVVVSQRQQGFAGNSDVTVSAATSFSSLDGSPQDFDGAADGTFTVEGNLTIAGGGSIFATGRRGGVNGIAIVVGGNFTMEPSTSIASGPVSGSDTAGIANDVKITATGDVSISPGAEIRADGAARAGMIQLHGRAVEIHGLLSSIGTTPVARGGVISVIASRDLTIFDLGVVRSEANRVHLEGCLVTVNGLVQSTGSGHSNLRGENSCDAPLRPGHTGAATSCVEVWAAARILIDSNAPQNGEIDVDTALSGLEQDPGWVELFSGGDILLSGDTSGAFAVHANQPNALDGRGGQIVATTLGGYALNHDINATGFAFQADAVLPGGDGGQITLLGAGSITADNVFGRGDFDPVGGFGKGGTLVAHAAGGLTASGDVRPTGTDVPPDRRGHVVLRASSGVSPDNFFAVILSFQFLGFPTSFSAEGFVELDPPALPQYAELPLGLCLGTPTPNLTPPTATFTPPEVTFTPTRTGTPNRIVFLGTGRTPTPRPNHLIENR